MQKYTKFASENNKKSLFEKYMSYIRDELISYKLGYTIKNSDTDIKIITKLFNAKQRFISPKKYLIKESKECKKTIKNLDIKYQEAYNEITLALSSALEIQPYLSTKIKKTDFFDKLLLDWNIHHLHLNTKNTNTYWVERSDYLLLFMIVEETVYMIDIVKHSKENVFEQQKYLEIVQNNWDYIINPCKINRDIDINEYKPLTDADIKILRAENINVGFVLNNKFHIGLGDAISGAGTNSRHQNEAIKIKKYLKNMDEYCKLNEKKICDEIYQETGIKLKQF